MEKNSGRARMEKRHGSNVEKKSTPVFVKYGLIALAAIAVIIAGVFLVFKLMEGNVATVGNEKIGVREYKVYLTIQKQSMLQIASQDPSFNEETFWSTKINGGETYLEFAKKKALESVQNTKIQLVKAKEAKIKLTDEEKNNIKSILKGENGIITKYGKGNRTKANKALMDEYGFGVDDFEKVQTEQYIISKYQTDELKKLGITTDKIKEYYDKNPDWYKESVDLRTNAEEAAWARHILIKAASDASQEDKDKAKNKAQDLLDKLKAGADFATLAKENSEDGNYQYGGEYIFGKGRMVSEFENAVFSLSPGQLYDGLVQTTYGYHVIKLEEKYAKDQPVSLKCATEFHDYGTSFIEGKLYNAKIEEWKKDAKYKFSKDDSVYNSIN